MPTKFDKPYRHAGIKGASKDVIDLFAERAEDHSGLPAPGYGRRMAASAQVSDYVVSRDLKPLTDNELKSIYALLAYVAHEQDAAKETVQSMVETSFNVNHVSKLQQKSFDEVIRFLVDLRIDEMCH